VRFSLRRFYACSLPANEEEKDAVVLGYTKIPDQFTFLKAPLQRKAATGSGFLCQLFPSTE
jgi:hypothetical protein